MNDQKPTLLYNQHINKVGINIIELEGYLITKPTVQIVSADKAIVHLLLSEETNYETYHHNTVNASSDDEMPPAYHAIITSNIKAIDRTGLHMALQKHSKIYIKCLNHTHHKRDKQGNTFKTNPLLVCYLTILPKDNDKKSGNT